MSFDLLGNVSPRFPSRTAKLFSGLFGAATPMTSGFGSRVTASEFGRTLVLLRQNSLRQRTRRTLIRRTREVIWVGRCRQRVIDVNDRGFAVLRIDSNLEQVEQITRPRPTRSAVSADDANVIG